MFHPSKPLVFILVLVSCLQAGGQGIGLKGGLNLASVLEKDNDHDYSQDYIPKAGFHAGITADIPLKDMFYLETGLLFEQKGFRYHIDVQGLEIKARTVLYYLDLPVNMKLRYKVEEELNVTATLGPYIGYGLWGNYRESFDFGGATDIELEIKWGNGEDDAVKRLDWGIGIGIGAEYAGLTVGLSFDLGLANLSPYTGDGDKLKNRVVRLSAGYFFGFGRGE